MKTEIKIQELSGGRFRNAVTGRIGDSIDAVVRVKDARLDPVSKEIRLLKKVGDELSRGFSLIERGVQSDNIANIDNAVIIFKKNIGMFSRLVNTLDQKKYGI